MAAPDFKLIAWLRDMGFDAHLNPPKSKTRFVTCMGLGGTSSNGLAHPSYSVQVYDESAERAASDAWAILKAMRFTQPPYGIGHASVEGSPYPLPDPDRPGLTCYRLTVTLTCQI